MPYQKILIGNFEVCLVRYKETRLHTCASALLHLQASATINSYSLVQIWVLQLWDSADQLRSLFQ
jgi:hypothetical protein